MNAQEYLLKIGFDDAHLPELFNNDDKGYYTIPELMEAYADTKTSIDYKCTCKHCKEEVFEEPWDICKTCEEVEIPDFLLNSKKLKLSLYHKGMKDNITFKLNAVDNQWLVIKSISDKYTHKLPICEIEIKELKQFLNENYPEL